MALEFDGGGAGEYLVKKQESSARLGSVDDVSADELEKRLGTILTNKIWAGEGSLEFGIGQGKTRMEVSVSYDSFLSEVAAHYFLKCREYSGVWSNVWFPSENGSWRRVKDLVLSGPLNSVRLAEEISGVEVYFVPDLPARLHTDSLPNKRVSGIWDPTNRLVLVFRDLRSLQALGTLFHEIGHARASHKRVFTSDSEADKAILITQERDANAYVLRVLRRFLDTQSFQDIRKSLHNKLLRYHDIPLGNLSEGQGSD